MASMGHSFLLAAQAVDSRLHRLCLRQRNRKKSSVAAADAEMPRQAKEKSKRREIRLFPAVCLVILYLFLSSLIYYQVSAHLSTLLLSSNGGSG